MSGAPVQALYLGQDRFQIVGYVPEGEKWAFQHGTIVRCRERTFSDRINGSVPVEMLLGELEWDESFDHKRQRGRD